MSRKIGGQKQDFAVTRPFDDELEDTRPFDDAFDDQDRDAPEPRRWTRAAIVAVLVTVGVASALLWRGYGDSLPALPSFASVTAPAAPPAAAPDKAVGLGDFQAFQQQTAGSLQSTAQLLAAQQAEIKRLSDQLSALTAKIDALQRPTTSAQAAIPPPAAPAVRKKPVAPKPAPAISTGGAPLPATPSR
jgi:uncharacterized coiled-coil protein SlyX